MLLENLNQVDNNKLEQDLNTSEVSSVDKYEDLNTEIKGLGAEVSTMEGDLLAANPDLANSPDGLKLQNINQEIKDLEGQTTNCVRWIKERFDLSKAEKFLDINIRGNDDFKEVIKGSLQFLALAPEKLAFVQQYIKTIEEWDHSGMNVFKKVPTFEVGDIWKDKDVELYLASSIAHDAYHSFLCQKSLDGQGNIYLDQFSGKQAEQACLAFQIDTLRDMAKNEYFNDHQAVIDELVSKLSELSKDPTYQDIPYKDRNW